MPRTSPASAAPPTTAATGVELDRKRAPTQTRALETCERILDAAANLLADVGIERLSTNLICERAGLSPPALYRYYPNKYAVLAELGVRLMMSQNELLEKWATPATMKLPAARFEERIRQLFLDTLVLTREAIAGEWITRALRAVPSLAPVRIESHDHVTGLIVAAFAVAWPAVPTARVRLVSRLAIEVMYSAQELLVDDATLDAGEVATVMSHMVTTQVVQLRRETVASQEGSNRPS
jgi:AcrR family transcriptional regulator